jgi:hypothetical protein
MPSEDLLRGGVAALADGVGELGVEVGVDREASLFLKRIGGHQIDELDHAGRVHGQVAADVGEARGMAGAEVDGGNPGRGGEELRIAATDVGHGRIEDFLKARVRNDRRDELSGEARVGNAGRAGRSFLR